MKETTGLRREELVQIVQRVYVEKMKLFNSDGANGGLVGGVAGGDSKACTAADGEIRRER